MTDLALTERIPEGDRVLLDTSALIAYFDGRERVSPFVTALVDDLIFAGRNRGIVSMVTVTEVLVRPRRANLEGYADAGDFFRRFPNLRAAPVDFAVAQEAASLRTLLGFKTPDALVIATGIVYQAGHLVTNDRDWKRKLEPMNARFEVCLLSDFA